MGSSKAPERRMTAVEKLRSMLADPDKFLSCPGVYDGFTARIALQEGVDCLYMVCLTGHCQYPALSQLTRLPRLVQEQQCPV